MFCSRCGAEANVSAHFCAQCGAVLTQPSAAAAAQEVTETHSTSPAYSGPVFAGFWRRAAAIVIDGIVLGLLIALSAEMADVVIAATYGDSAVGEDKAFAVRVIALILIILLLPLLYFSIFEAARMQATPGKRLLGIKVVARDGHRLPIVQALIRTMAKLLPGALLFPFSFLMAGFTLRKRALHDFITRTLVIRTPVTASALMSAQPLLRDIRWWGGLLLTTVLSVGWGYTLGGAVLVTPEGRELQRSLGWMPPDEPLLTGKSGRPAR